MSMIWDICICHRDNATVSEVISDQLWNRKPRKYSVALHWVGSQYQFPVSVHTVSIFPFEDYPRDRAWTSNSQRQPSLPLCPPPPPHAIACHGHCIPCTASET